jgi:16S rRNA (guanine1207-N2)-methyltransferase
MSEESLKALFYPLESGARQIAAGSRVLYVNGQVCSGLSYLSDCDLTVQQYFRPYAAALERASYKTVTEVEETGFDTAFVYGGRQREETMYALAAAVRAVKPRGLIVCAAANDAGGKRLAADVKNIGLAPSVISKYKSRIVIAENASADGEQIDAARRAGSYQTVMNGEYISRPGIFCWDRVDVGSALLTEALPALAGRGADFGCGYGYISANILKSSSAVTEIACIDADLRAIEACRRTLGQTGINENRIRYFWSDITNATENLPVGLDWIAMNPPFHQGSSTLPRIGSAFIERAAACLRPGGTLWMVANANLPYEKILAANFSQSDRLLEGKGYKVYKAER